MLAEERDKAKATERSRLKVGILIVLATVVINGVSALFMWAVTRTVEQQQAQEHGRP